MIKMSLESSNVGHNKKLSAENSLSFVILKIDVIAIEIRDLQFIVCYTCELLCIHPLLIVSAP
jgi:hypothetical protein